MTCGAPGERCGMLPIGPSGHCQRHDPQQAEIRRRQSSLAAKRSHEWTPDPEIETWAQTLDFDDDAARKRSLKEVAALVARGGLSPAQGQAIAALARAAEGKPSTKVPEKRALVVELQQHGNGHDPRDAA